LYNVKEEGASRDRADSGGRKRNFQIGFRNKKMNNPIRADREGGEDSTTDLLGK